MYAGLRFVFARATSQASIYAHLAVAAITKRLTFVGRKKEEYNAEGNQ